MKEIGSRKSAGEFYKKEMRIIRKLNMLFIVQRFRKYLHNGDTFFNRSKEFFKGINASEKMIEAGYELKNTYDSFPFFEVALVFTARKGVN